MPEFGANLLPVMLLLTRLLIWARLRRFFPKEYGSPACLTNLAILETGAQALSSVCHCGERHIGVATSATTLRIPLCLVGKNQPPPCRRHQDKNHPNFNLFYRKNDFKS
ncbi:hypothetical protein Peur_011565 [Populus x canadensis]